MFSEIETPLCQQPPGMMATPTKTVTPLSDARLIKVMNQAIELCNSTFNDIINCLRAIFLYMDNQCDYTQETPKIQISNL